MNSEGEDSSVDPVAGIGIILKDKITCNVGNSKAFLAMDAAKKTLKKQPVSS